MISIDLSDAAIRDDHTVYFLREHRWNLGSNILELAPRVRHIPGQVTE
jgi:hypothetical protein